MSKVERATLPEVQPTSIAAARIDLTGAATERPFRAAWLAALLCVLAVAYGPLLWLFFRQQWQKPHYQYFPFVIVAFAWLLWQRCSQSTPKAVDTSAKNRFARGLVVLACFVLLFGIAIRSPWCAMVSLIVLTASVFCAISQARNVINLWGIFVLLWLLVPVPLNFDQRLTQMLQRVSSRLSSYVLDLIGTLHLMDGNTLWLKSKQLFVDEACSGIISMLSVVACAVIYAVVKNRAPLHLLLLAATGVVWAALFNIARISIIAFVLDEWGMDWSTGASHEILGLVLFLFTLLALMSTDQLLIFILMPVIPAWRELRGCEMGIGRRLGSAFDALVALGQPGAATADPAMPTHHAMRPPVRYSSRLVLPLFVPVALIQSTVIMYAFHLAPHRLPMVQRGLQITSSDLPATLCGLEKVSFEAHQRGRDNVHGMYSRTFTYRSKEGDLYTISFDFPFPAVWHELTECYAATGWERVERHVRSEREANSQESWDYVEARFSKPDSRFGILYFSEFDQDGMKFKPQQDWLREQGPSWGARNSYLSEIQLFQVQVWVTVVGNVSEMQRRTARDLFYAARERLRHLVVNPAGTEAAVSRIQGFDHTQ